MKDTNRLIPVLLLFMFSIFMFACGSQKNTETTTSHQKTDNNVPVIQDRPIPNNQNTDRPIPVPNPTDKPTNQAPPTPTPKPNTGKDCIDLSKATKEMCQRLYEPVCGCDGMTYTNACLARNAGVLKWTNGECK